MDLSLPGTCLDVLQSNMNVRVNERFDVAETARRPESGVKDERIDEIETYVSTILYDTY